MQAGCEELADDPELPQPESFAQVLEAFLAVRTLRRERGVELDRYYLGPLTKNVSFHGRKSDYGASPRASCGMITSSRSFSAVATTSLPNTVT